MPSLSLKAPTTIQTFGNSMLPLFHDGDVLTLHKTSFKNIAVDDFVTFKKKNRYVTHRVIYKSPAILDSRLRGNDRRNGRNPFIITKGDNNLQPDAKVFPHQIVGIVKRIKRDTVEFDPYTINLIQSTAYFGELVAITSLFAQNDVRYLILKGLPLHLFYEKTHPKRIYADCDILIHPKSVRKAESVLRKAGYKRQESAFSKTHKKLKDKKTEETFYKQTKNYIIMLDIHYEPVFLMNQVGTMNNLFSQKVLTQMREDFFHHVRTITIQGSSFPILSPDYLILYLGLHLFHHNFKGYYRYELMKNILKKEKIKWKQFHDLCQKYTVGLFIYPVFFHLRKDYNCAIPNSFLTDLEPKTVIQERLIATLLKESIFEDEYRIQSGIQRFTLILMLSTNNWFKKMLVFADVQIVYSIAWTLQKLISIYVVRKKKLFVS